MIKENRKDLEVVEASLKMVIATIENEVTRQLCDGKSAKELREEWEKSVWPTPIPYGGNWGMFVDTF